MRIYLGQLITKLRNSGLEARPRGKKEEQKANETNAENLSTTTTELMFIWLTERDRQVMRQAGYLFRNMTSEEDKEFLLQAEREIAVRLVE